MKKSKSSKRNKSKSPVSRRTRIIVIPILFIVGIGVIILTVIYLIALPKSTPGVQYGVGADGFFAKLEEDGSLGIDSIVSKSQVTQMLADKAKSVGEAKISKVFNLNGDRSQAITFPFVRADNTKVRLYIDTKLYKNTKALDDDHIYVLTAKAGTIQEHPAYFKHAQTIDGNREYHLMVVNGLKAYRFVIEQPIKNITINEISALAVLKKLALEAKL
ncbi:MAG: hypothetical protein WAW80_05090 [Candidatus Saccharimonadales bacterium]